MHVPLARYIGRIDTTYVPTDALGLSCQPGPIHARAVISIGEESALVLSTRPLTYRKGATGALTHNCTARWIATV